MAGVAVKWKAEIGGGLCCPDGEEHFGLVSCSRCYQPLVPAESAAAATLSRTFLARVEGPNAADHIAEAVTHLAALEQIRAWAAQQDCLASIGRGLEHGCGTCPPCRARALGATP